MSTRSVVQGACSLNGAVALAYDEGDSADAARWGVEECDSTRFWTATGSEKTVLVRSDLAGRPTDVEHQKERQWSEIAPVPPKTLA